ncbi:M48 family metalloprotease [Promethearchaeum syntrophicum]|uniref:M48 family metalloprotease n=1 Tax=Promethearchaeum syntrophicum TaxID=2594042 RepID=A0A5B9D9H2_9ARCH|nr:M48 family metalloprotease [Candidatus Prometheoarchaeum syntrophicum]QEE15380.1 heat shock protein HtpX [Candidatus Prometheoarchaeum syntrophicum]
MKKNTQIVLLISFIVATIGIISSLFIFTDISLPTTPLDIGLWIAFGITFIFLINEGISWVKNSKRSDWSDLVVIIFLFITVYLFTKDIMNSFIGSFSLYLIFGIYELKEYEVLNKILLITVITYNFIFFAGILDTILAKDGLWRDTAFSMSFWLMLILGFAFFGRKYMVVFRFMSPQYLTLALYLVAWLAISSIKTIPFTEISLYDYIYEVIIITNVIVYIFTGPLIDLLMGYKKSDDPELTRIIEEVAVKMGMNPKKIKIRFGKYPIINAMAYGAFWDMRMAVIAPNLKDIPEDELKGIVAHELAHLKGKHTLSLTLISIGEILVFKLLKWPVTYYDYTFNPDDQPFPLFVFILISLGISIFLYTFVRMFEATADKNTKKAGYGKELARGLYNLESFYAASHEIGLDATLLSDEKVSENNRLINYMSTAQYLNKMIIKPSKGGLLSNFINAHPPSYHRIIASLDENDISTTYEALMPIIFLRKKKAEAYFVKTDATRQKYMNMATTKVKKQFKIENIKNVAEQLKLKEKLSYKIGKTYAFLNLKTNERLFGKLEDIFYVDNASEPLRYKIKVILGKNPDEIKIINPFIHKEMPLTYGEHYKYRKEGILRLRNIELDAVYFKNGKNKKKSSQYLKKYTGVAIFEKISNNNEDSTLDEVKIPIFKKRNMPKSYEELESIKGEHIFLKKQGTYQMYKLDEVIFKENYLDYTLKLVPTEKNETEKVNEVETNEFEFSKDNLVIKHGDFYFNFHNDEATQKFEDDFLKYYAKHKLDVVFILKKAVNAEIDGKIENFEYNEGNISKISIKNNFNEEFIIEKNKIDVVYIQKPKIVIQNVKDISVFTNLMNKIGSQIHPEKFFN